MLRLQIGNSCVDRHRGHFAYLAPSCTINGTDPKLFTFASAAPCLVCFDGGLMLVPLWCFTPIVICGATLKRSTKWLLLTRRGARHHYRSTTSTIIDILLRIPTGRGQKDGTTRVPVRIERFLEILMLLQAGTSVSEQIALSAFFVTKGQVSWFTVHAWVATFEFVIDRCRDDLFLILLKILLLQGGSRRYIRQRGSLRLLDRSTCRELLIILRWFLGSSPFTSRILRGD